MEIAIFSECLLIILLLAVLLLRQRICVIPNNDWAVISEAFTKDIWNETVDLEDRFQQNPLFQLADDDDDLGHIRAALEQSAQIAVEVGSGIRERSFYGVPVPVEAYCSRASCWYFDIACHYEAWAEHLGGVQKSSASLAKGTAMAFAKGAVRGAIGGWTQVFSMFTEPDAETPEAHRREAFQADSHRLNYVRKHLDSERVSVQAFLGGMFDWQFDEDA